MKTIHKDHNGVFVLAYDAETSGCKEGHSYAVAVPVKDSTEVKYHVLQFQDGPIQEAGTNGITNEALLAVLIDRLGLLNKKFPCRENSIVITKLEESLMWLEKRTKDRIARGVEGQNKA